MRRALMSAVLLGCGSNSDSGSESSFTDASPCATPDCSATTGGSSSGGSSTSTGSSAGTSSSSTGDATDSMGTFNPVSESGMDDSSSGEPVDCSTTPDCASCWECAKTGPCNAGYSSCEAAFNCIPSLVCSQGCANDGLAQACVSNCCMSCTDLMTCPMVDAVISCIETACAAQCSMVTCP